MTEKFAREERLEYLKDYGNFCMAYSTLQPGVRYFDYPKVGYISYAPINPFVPIGKATAFVFCDPVCSDDSDVRELLLDRFLSAFKNAVFVQNQKQTAEILSKKGYFVTPLGVETVLPVQTYKISGNKKSRLKEAFNRGKKKQRQVYELDGDISRKEKEELFQRMKDLSKEWMVTRKVGTKEIRYVTRPAVYDEEKYVRKFFVLNYKGEIEGFSFYDPIFSGKKIIGYTPSVARFSPNAFKGINYFTNIDAVFRFYQENIEELNLGLSPFYGVADHRIHASSPNLYCWRAISGRNTAGEPARFRIACPDATVYPCRQRRSGSTRAPPSS